jgi:tetratricopeptide (TPR) repeat protein
MTRSAQKTFLQAHGIYKSGRYVEAANILRHSLREAPTHAASFHLLGIIEAKSKRLEVALKCFDAAVAIEPQHAPYLVDRANVVASLGTPEEAISAYDRALEIDPGLAEAWSNRGQALRLLKRSDEAIESFERAIKLKPRFVDAHCFLGDALMEQSKFELGIRAYTKTLELNSAHVAALLNRGNCYTGLGKFEEAAKDYRALVEVIPEHAEAQGRLANALIGLERFRTALEAADRAIAIQPNNVEWHLGRGKALAGLGRHPEALLALEKAESLGADRTTTLLLRGSVLLDMNRIEEAMQFYDEGARLDPTGALWPYNRGFALARLRRYPEALVAYDEAISRDPNHATAHWNSALALLAQGDPRGWDLYEWRWKLPEGGPDPASQPQGLTRWLGYEPLEGKRILITAEQGLGDTIMFSRYAPQVTALGATVHLAVQKGLVRLLSTLPNITSVISRDTPTNLASFDYFCPLISLPRIFECDFTNIPAGDGPYLKSDPQLVDLWRERFDKLAAAKGSLRVGIMWSGKQVKSLGVRSMDLATLLKLQHERVQLISLQKDLAEADLELLRAANVPHFGEEQTDFADAAAMIDLCDLVVTIDTSIAHLAGALGKDTWIMLQYDAEWRWLQDRTDSPWYPRARLFKQPIHGDWESVIAAIRQALSDQV